MSEWLGIFEGAPIRKVATGDAVFRREDRVQFMYLVRSGTVALERHLPDGVPLTLHIATANMALAEASLFSERYHCDAVARSDVEVASLPRQLFLDAVLARPDAALSLVRMHATEVQAQRTRIEILRLRRVADRLDAWLALYGTPIRGGWVSVAEQIGVSPAALYRELARRRDRSEAALPG